MAVVLAEKIQLPFRFHAFGDDIHVQGASHFDDRADNGRVVAIDVGIADKRPVNLQRVDRKTLERRKRRVTGAEIIGSDRYVSLADRGLLD